MEIALIPSWKNLLTFLVDCAMGIIAIYTLTNPSHTRNYLFRTKSMKYSTSDLKSRGIFQKFFFCL